MPRGIPKKNPVGRPKTKSATSKPARAKTGAAKTKTPAARKKMKTKR